MKSRTVQFDIRRVVWVSRVALWVAAIVGSVLGVMGSHAARAMGPALSPPGVRILSDSLRVATIAAAMAPEGTAVHNLEYENVRVDVTLPSGGIYPGYLTMIRSLETGIFWWAFQGSGDYDPPDQLAHFRKTRKVYSSDRELLVAQVAYPPAMLWFRRSTRAVDSMDKGRWMALEDIAQQAQALEGGTARWMRVARLADLSAPRCSDTTASTSLFVGSSGMPRPGSVQIDAIVRTPMGWEIGLTSLGGRRAVIEVDSLFNLVSERMIELPALPGPDL